jgi:hypothetical protein
MATSLYPQELKVAARRLLENEDFKLVLNYHSENLAKGVLDSTEDKDILAAHSEYGALRNFVEFLRMVQGSPEN